MKIFYRTTLSMLFIMMLQGMEQEDAPGTKKNRKITFENAIKQSPSLNELSLNPKQAKKEIKQNIKSAKGYLKKIKKFDNLQQKERMFDRAEGLYCLAAGMHLTLYNTNGSKVHFESATTIMGKVSVIGEQRLANSLPLKIHRDTQHIWSAIRQIQEEQNRSKKKLTM